MKFYPRFQSINLGLELEKPKLKPKTLASVYKELGQIPRLKKFGFTVSSPFELDLLFTETIPFLKTLE